MKTVRRILNIMALALMAGAMLSVQSAHSGILTPTAASSTTQINTSRTMATTIDGSHLSSGGTSGDILSETHEVNTGNGPHYWLSGNLAGDFSNETLIFTLASASFVNAVHIWGYNRGGTNRSIQNFDLHFSTDGGLTYPVMLSLGLARPGAPIAVQTLNFAQQSGVTHLKITNITNYGDGNYVGLSEIRFGAPDVPAVALSNDTVAVNAPPGTLVGTLSMAVVNGPYTFTKTGNGNNHTAFEIPAGTNELRTTTFLDAPPPFEVEIQGVGSDGNATTSFTINLNPATYSAFIASAGVLSGVPTGGEVVATLSARDSDASSITSFGIVGGRDDLFQISGNELQQKAGADPGAPATIHYVTLLADGAVDTFVILAIEVGAPPGTVIRFR